MRSSLLADALIAWLKEPCVKVCLSDDGEKTALQQENEALRLELERMRVNYADMANLQLRYADILREHGIPLK